MYLEGAPKGDLFIIQDAMASKGQSNANSPSKNQQDSPMDSNKKKVDVNKKIVVSRPLLLKHTQFNKTSVLSTE